ncbi:MAG: DUF4249 domain-containing protein [Rikenellaceae bacterium]|nr:DUF4249 domain-containing protein [Rikenellaceae bacterium]
MKNSYIKFPVITLLAAVVLSCISPFEPKGASVEGLLVVEGDIILNDTTVITLSRSTAISSTQSKQYVFAATVWVESSDGGKYYGVSKVENGVLTYLIPTAGLSTTAQYRLKVNTPNGGQYESNFVTALETPDIEDITWSVDSVYQTATFFVTSKASENNSNYYRWDYTEDWEFTSRYNSFVYFDSKNNKIVDTVMNWYYCYKKGVSTGIYVANTSSLSENRVYKKPIATFGKHDDRLCLLYSMEVTQRSLTREGYLYWENLSKNSSDLGGIFSPQPSELKGNITCLSDPEEVVLGFISAVTTKKKRIFAYAKDIRLFDFGDDCSIVEGVSTWADMKNGGYELVGFDDMTGATLWAMKKCVDCRLTGTKNRPSFWPLHHE